MPIPVLNLWVTWTSWKLNRNVGRPNGNRWIVSNVLGHKSHIGQKKCFTPKYREKCFNGAYSLLWTVDTHKSIYHLKAYSQKIPLVPWLNQMIQGVQIKQGGTLKLLCIFVKFSTLTCSLILRWKPNKAPLLKEHYWDLPYQDKIHFPYFWGREYRVIKKWSNSMAESEFLNKY